MKKIFTRQEVDHVKIMIDDAAQEAIEWRTSDLNDLVKKAKAVKDIAEADKHLRNDGATTRFAIDTISKVALFAAFAVWEERHVIGKTLSTLLRGGRV